MSDILHGDCLEELKNLPDDSVDTVITDPPYFLINESGTGFMGKAWDGIIGLWKYLWLDPTFVKGAEQILLSLQVEPNTAEVSTAPERASTPQLENQSQKTVSSVNQSSSSCPPQLKDFAGAVVLTKREVLDLLHESLPSHMRAEGGFLQSVSDNARFVIPPLLLKRKVKNAVVASALSNLTKQTCEGNQTQLSLMDAARINVAIEATIGKTLEKKSIDEIIGLASHAGSTATDEKYNVTTLSLTDSEEATKCLTLLLFALNATPTSKTAQYFLIDNFFTSIYRECIRVLKPGAFMAVCMTPRQDILSRAMLCTERAGFVNSFTPIYWTYASGFPKAGNVGKLVDKRLGAEREVIGTKVGLPGYSDTGETQASGYEGGFKDPKKEVAITAPATPLAKALDGSYTGFQPKPAVEVVIVAMKPLSEKTYVDQALKNGKGITWLDDGRIPTQPRTTHKDGNYRGTAPFESEMNTGYQGAGATGRFPANLLVSDDVLNDGVISKGSYRPSGSRIGKGSNTFGNMPTLDVPNALGYNDSGSYSRYFDLDAFFKKLCETSPTLLGLERQGALHGNVYAHSTARKDLLCALRRLYDTLDTVAGSVLGGRSWHSFLSSNDGEYAQSLKLLLDSQGGYPSYRHLYDEHARLGEEADLELARLHSDVHKQSLAYLPLDGRDDKDAGTCYSYLVSCALLPIIVEVVPEVNIDALPEQQAKTFPFAIFAKASKSEKNKGLVDITCSHPTVKPLKLMAYLITLFSREGDTVLDPFVGSGTTVVAAEQLGRKGIGIEREAEYAEIARARLAHIKPLPEEPESVPPVTMDEVLKPKATKKVKPEQLRLI